MSPKGVLPVLALSLLSASASLAADPAIRPGIDVFTTSANGKTHYSFARNPIPAGFFCNGSQPFAGRVAFKGLPLATGSPGQIWDADTVIERLDTAVFNAKGTARTRIQFRALSLVSIAPLETACGAFHVYVSLAGPQRITRMRIDRTDEKGGVFVAPLAVDARLTFIPVKPAQTKGAKKLELTGRFTFPAQPLPWRLREDDTTKSSGRVVVDTNGDQIPDALLPGTSNFAPGRYPKGKSTDKYLYATCCETCHDWQDGELHCYFESNCVRVVCEN